MLDNRSEHVPGAMTYAMDVEGAAPGLPYGSLNLPHDARLRDVDGQHRRPRLSEAIRTVDDVAQDSTALLIYVEDDLQQRRQMSSDMKWTPRRVSASQNVAFKGRDPFSRATRRLERSHTSLKGRVEEDEARVARGCSHLVTLGAVYDACKRLTLGPNGGLEGYAGPDEEGVVDRAKRFLDLLGTRPQLQVSGAGLVVHGLRGSSILISSTTSRAVAGAAHRRITHHHGRGTAFSLQYLMGPLAGVDFCPDAKLQVSSGFVSPGRITPNDRNQEVLKGTNLLAGELLGLRGD